MNFIKLLSCILFLSVVAKVHSQTYTFAKLSGSPMNTTGWNLVGDAHIGDTQGDNTVANDELILCNPLNFNSGACFYSKPVNISLCQKWTAEFDYRIFDGNGADGIAFCFLANPPTGFTTGGNVGIPSRPRGLMVILDTYLNCSGNTGVPKLEIRYYDGSVTFGGNTEATLECPNPSQPTSGTLPILRQSNYNHMKIIYSAGDIKVYINNSFVLQANYKISFPGYFGFTSSTGGNNDRHSIKDFTLYTFKPIVSPPNAGADKTICNGDSVQLGVPKLPGDPYTYSWNPTAGLSDPTIPNPKLRLDNNTASPITYTYFVTKDSLLNDTLCAYSDDVKITVQGKVAKIDADFSICSGVKKILTALKVNDYKYLWSPSIGLDNPTLSSPTLQLFNNTTSPVVYQYVLKATSPVGSCESFDTLNVTVYPNIAKTGSDLNICSGDLPQIGTAPVSGYQYSWQPSAGLSNPSIANPVFLLANNSDSPVSYQYILTASGTTCTTYDTINITVFPKAIIKGPKSVCPNVKGVFYEITNSISNVNYDWAVAGGSIKSGQGTTKIEVDWGTSGSALVSVKIASNANCTTELPVTINKLLIPEKPITDTTKLCLAQAKGIAFETINTTGSIYTWNVSTNGTIVSGQGTNRILVDWQSPGIGKIWVIENTTTQTDVCSGISDTLFIKISPPPDPESVIIKSVSVDTAEDKSIDLHFQIKNDPDLQNDFIISRRTFLPAIGNWNTIKNVAKSDTIFIDKNLDIGNISYEYKIDGNDVCNLPVSANPHHSIVLKGESKEADTLVTLNWNEYGEWKNGVKKYEIWRKLDDGDYILYETADAAQLNFSRKNAFDGFKHCYRIKAIENQGLNSYSWSNEVCVEFEHPLWIPNVIIPNNDGRNDVWYIKNLYLYAENDLIIVNRYGKQVFQANHYQQNWSGENVSGDVYYYFIKTGPQKREYRGWIQVIK